MMNTSFFMYNNKVYNIVNYIEIEGIIFAIASDYDNKYTYFKYSKVNDKVAFTPFESLTGILPQYQTIAVQNMVNFMDVLVKLLTRNPDQKETIFEKANDIISAEKNNFKESTYQDLSVEYFEGRFIHELELYTKKTLAELLQCEIEAPKEEKAEEVNTKPKRSVNSNSAKQVFACLFIIIFVCLIHIFTNENTWNNKDNIMRSLVNRVAGIETTTEVDSDMTTAMVTDIEK